MLWRRNSFSKLNFPQKKAAAGRKSILCVFVGEPTCWPKGFQVAGGLAGWSCLFAQASWAPTKKMRPSVGACLQAIRALARKNRSSREKRDSNPQNLPLVVFAFRNSLLGPCLGTGILSLRSPRCARFVPREELLQWPFPVGACLQAIRALASKKKVTSYEERVSNPESQPSVFS